ncbi:MAG: glycosyltransferase family 4 protein [Rhodoferax sp.]|nr:glycosyltransferase family 4 protein [Rhodoferax sp.]
MKVVHVVRQYLPSIGGMEEMVRNLAQQQLCSGRYQPSILTLNRVFRSAGAVLPGRAVLDGVPVQRLGYGGSERYPLCPQVALALGGADLVHVHGIDFFFDYLALLHPVLRKPLLASTHGGFFHSGFASGFKQVYFRSITLLSATAYRRVIATSENDGALFSRVVAAGRLRVIENGVDLQKFQGAATGTLQPVLIYFGRWSRNKGLGDCLQLLAALCRQQPDVPWQLIIAGREYDLDAAALQQQAQALGVAQRMELHPNPDHSALRRLIARSSYFLCLSQHEGFGIAPIEAISAGLVPLLSAIAPFVRLHQQTGCGLLLETGQAETQALQIARLHAQLLHSQNHSSALAAVQERVQRYGWTGVAARYAQEYDQAMEHL